MGEVWRAEDRLGGGDAAVKLLHKEVQDSDHVRTRFEREGRLLSELVHPNIARLRAWEASKERSFLALDFISGPTLFSMLRDHAVFADPPALARIIAIVRGIAAGLDAAHAAGIVHRDLKPGNVMLRVAGRGGANADDPVIVDFGAAKVALPPSEGTTVGRVLGSWLYMSPEQIRGEPADRRADIFALAVMSFELITMRRPFARDERGEPISFASREVAEQIRSGALLRWMMLEPPPLAHRFREGIAESASAVIARGFAPERDARHESAGVFAEELANALGATVPQRRIAREPSLTRVEQIGTATGTGTERSTTLPPALERVPSITPVIVASVPPPRPGLGTGTLAFGALMLATGLLLGVVLTRTTSSVEPAAPVESDAPRARAAPAITAIAPAEVAQPAPVREARARPLAAAKVAEPAPRAPPSPLELALEVASHAPNDPDARRALRSALESAKAAASPALRAELDRCLTTAQFRPDTESLIACAKAALASRP